MTKKETAKRYALFIISLFFAAVGVAFTKHGELGVSPISSVANVMSCRFDFLSLGTWLIIWNGILIAGQIAILGRQFQPVQLLQIPVSFLFGWFTDLGNIHDAMPETIQAAWPPYYESALYFHSNCKEKFAI